jgi:heptosyltransferase II
MGNNSPARLIVRAPNWIGDAVMALPALMDLREELPHAKITVLARPAIGELLSGHPAVDDLIIYSKQYTGLTGFWQLVQLIRKRRFDQAVLFQNAFEAAVIAWAAGIPSRIGYATDGRRGLLSQSIPRPQQVHHIQYYRCLVQAITHSPGQDRVPQLFLKPDIMKACAGRFPDLFSSAERMCIGMNPGSVYGSAKRWLPERFAEVGDTLVERVTGRLAGASLVQCVIIGGKGEELLAQDIAGRMRYPPIVLSGKTTVSEMMGVLSQCSVLVTNDTGPMHVAHALGVPVTAIFGSTDPSATGLSGQPYAMIKASSVRCAPCLLRACPIDHRCMTQVTVEQVVEAAWSQMKVLPGIDKEPVRGPYG